MKIKTYLVILSLLFPAALIAEERTYICSAEEATGYDYTNGRWLRERFRPDAKYQVKYSDSAWSVYEYQTESESDICELMDEDVLKCEINGEFIMNFSTLKFSVTNTAPYVHSTRRNRESVILVLGECLSM